jgi:hypothetical protein
VVLLKQVDERLGLTRAAARAVGDQRRAASVEHGAYFSDRGRPFQADRGRQDGVAEAALGKRAGTGLNVAQSSTISLKRAAVGRVSGVVLSPT